MAYIDVELLLTTWIHATRGVKCVTELPSNLADVLPVVQVQRIAGADVELTLDQAVVDIDVYAADRASARLLADQVRHDMRLNLHGYTGGGGVVALVEVASGPHWLPYDNTNLRRYQASYRVTVHSAP